MQSFGSCDVHSPGRVRSTDASAPCAHLDSTRCLTMLVWCVIEVVESSMFLSADVSENHFLKIPDFIKHVKLLLLVLGVCFCEIHLCPEQTTVLQFSVASCMVPL